MKTKAITFLVFLVLSTTAITASVVYDGGDHSGGGLLGSLRTNSDTGQKSLVVSLPRNQGNIKVEVRNATGSLVYVQTVDTYFQNQLIVDVTKYAKGTYSLVKVDQTGRTTSSFVIN